MTQNEKRKLGVAIVNRYALDKIHPIHQEDPAHIVMSIFRTMSRDEVIRVVRSSTLHGMVGAL